jgi:hypothetical protein
MKPEYQKTREMNGFLTNSRLQSVATQAGHLSDISTPAKLIVVRIIFYFYYFFTHLMDSYCRCLNVHILLPVLIIPNWIIYDTG